MVTLRSIAAAALLGACVAAGSFRSVEGVKACAECTGSTTCIVEDTGTRLTAGSSQLTLKLCNFSASATYSLAFSLKLPPACDSTGALVPKAKSLKAVGACAANAECAVVAELESPIDWAIVMRSGSELQGLLASFKSGGSAESVTVAVGQDLNGATMAAADAAKVAATSVSVCASEVAISAQRLSRVDGCSTADVCRGKASDAACAEPLKAALPVTGVSCRDAECSGKVALSGALSCAAAAGDSRALVVAVKVANSALSNYAGVGTLAAPAAAAVSDVTGLAAGSARFAIAATNVCAAADVQVNVTGGVAVASLNTSNGSVAVTLAAPLARTLDGSKLQVTLTQCGVASKAFEALVGGDDSGDAGSSKAGGNSSSVGGDGARGTESTQRTDVRTGLSGGTAVGIGIGTVALLGFAFECWFHKRRQPPPEPRAFSGSDATPMTTGLGHHAM